jgi:uncharacterized protein (DUF2384 family)
VTEIKLALIKSLQKEAADRVQLISVTGDSTISKLHAECRSYFETDLEFAKWLITPLAAVGGDTPLRFAEEPSSIAKLADYLDAIDYGIFS